MSSLASRPACSPAPAAIGFIGTAFTPRARNAWMSAQAASVLPTPVSVPVTNTPRLTVPASA